MKHLQIFEKYNLETEFRTLLENYEFLDINIEKRKDFLDTMFSSLLEYDDFDPFSHLQAKDEIDIKTDCVLTFGDTNVKMKKLGVVYFSLPAGYTCPFADICKSFAHKTGGKFSNNLSIRDDGDIRCYAASSEMRFPGTREKRWKNMDLLNEFGKDVIGLTKLIETSMKYYEIEKNKISILRIHESGDFFTQEYFDAWMNVAKKRPDVLFYCYTKAIPFVVARKNEIPRNFRIVGSVGGKEDELLFANPWIRKAHIVNTIDDAMRMKLNIDINDFLAIGSEVDYALLLHGGQQKGTKLAKQTLKNSALMKKIGKTRYSDKKALAEIAKKYTI